MMSEDRASNCVEFDDLYGRTSVFGTGASTNGELMVPKSRKGVLDKLASGVVKNWKTRYFQLDKGTLVYYEPTHWYVKGQYDLIGLIFAHNFPGDTPEMIRLQIDGRPDIVLKAKDISTKNKWRQSLADHIRYATTIKERELIAAQQQHSSIVGKQLMSPSSRPVVSRSTTVTAPPECKGWLWKKGQIMPTIKKRFFMLIEGRLSYYASDVTSLMEDTPDGEIGGNIARSAKPKPLGELYVTHYQIYSDDTNGRIEIILTPGARSDSARKLSIFCDDFTQKDIWTKALTSHAAFDPQTGQSIIDDDGDSIN